MTLIKRIFIIFMIFISIFFSLYGIGILYGRVRASYLVNWHIILPKPIKEENIIFAGWSDSVYSDVLYYNNDKYIKKVKGLTKFNDENVELFRNKLDDYLDFVEGYGEEYLKTLNKKVNIYELINEDNYYFYKQDKELENRFLIMLTDTSNNALYLFVSNN